ncbi:MAG TPA: class I SAM-dependent methyltransferase [Ferrovibrio sp.]|uniref:class I SAM-dependent methyltransferase n=1 Tax=Ferrovibrio sp. TaxID=1917215 RepID=UPI002ED0884E
MTSEDPRNAPGKDPGTWFGFREVAESEKAPLVRGVFDSVAGRYDLMNDLMSGGIHRLWKASMIAWLAPRPGLHLVDVAGGTGDIAFRILDRIGGPEAAAASGSRITVCDMTPAMLAVGRDRAIDRGLLAGSGSGGGWRIGWVAGDAESLPLADRSCDAYTIAFGLRNVTRIDRALAEARRVLRPGGRFLCLEFSRVALPVLAGLYDLYSFRVLPLLGQMVAGDRESYQYLVESIRRFPPQEDLAARIAAAGLGQVKFRNLSGGIAALHSAWRI